MAETEAMADIEAGSRPVSQVALADDRARRIGWVVFLVLVAALIVFMIWFRGKGDGTMENGHLAGVEPGDIVHPPMKLGRAGG